MQPGQDDPYQQQPPGSYPPPGSGGPAYPPPGSGGPAYPPPPGSGGPGYPPPPGSGYPPPPGSGGPGYPPPDSGAGGYPPPQPYGTGQPPPYGAPGYGTPGYGAAPGYGYPGGAAPQNTQGLVSMILGIASIPLLCCFWLGLPLGIAAAILGFLGLNKAKAGLATNRGQALAGLICGGVAVVLGIAAVLYTVIAGTWNFSTYRDFG
jgi:hypothetical protein